MSDVLAPLTEGAPTAVPADPISAAPDTSPPACDRSLLGRALVYGLQGSGNVVAQHVVREILGPRLDFDPIGHEAMQRHHEVVRWLETLAGQLGVPLYGPGYGRPGVLNAALGDAEDQVVLPAIPSDVFLAESVYGTHALPEPDDVAAYRAAGGKVLVVLRHPLDVMTSFATKNVPHDWPDRAAARDRLLRDPDFVSVFAWQIEVFWEQFRQIERSVVALRYEDLIRTPRLVLSHVAAFVDRELSAERADALLSQIGTAELAGPGHLFRGKPDAWRQSLPPTQLPFFEHVRTLASPYGYDWEPASEYRAPTPSLSFHVCGYSFWHPAMRRFLEDRDLVHGDADLPYIGRPDSPSIPRLADLLAAHREQAGRAPSPSPGGEGSPGHA